MRTHKHIPKNQRTYEYAPRPETPVVTKDLKGILGEMYGDTYKGPYVHVTHKQAFEARVAKRLAKAAETYADGAPIVCELGESEESITKRLAVQEASIDKIESLPTVS